jgi:catechol 2,3-dioxygenase-like lactoylglutathione lyase family enzyme
MLQDVSHTGITVQNIEQSLAFYRDLLGLEIIFERLASEEFVQRPLAATGPRPELAPGVSFSP